MKLHYIYSFRCPLTQKILYIGRTNNINRRIRGHMGHIKSGKYVRHPFKCKLTSLYYRDMVEWDVIIKSFEILEVCISEVEAIEREKYYIHNVYGIGTLLNICNNTEFGGDTFTNNPNKEDIRNKLKGRTPWNKGKEMPDETKLKCSKTWFKEGPKLIYKLTSPSGQSFELLGQNSLKEFCLEWRKKHKAISVKDLNWISPTAFKMEGKGNSSLKGWMVEKKLSDL